MPEEEKKIEVQTSSMFSWNFRDAIQGSIMIAIGAIMGPLIQSLEKWTIVTDWRSILIGGLIAGLSHMARKYFQPSATIVKVMPPAITEQDKQEIKQAVQEHTDEKT